MSFLIPEAGFPSAANCPSFSISSAWRENLRKRLQESRSLIITQVLIMQLRLPF